MGRRREAALLSPPSGFPARRSSWLSALLAASILSSCFLRTEARSIPVMVEPSHPLEGQAVTLTPGGSVHFIICRWFRGELTEKNQILRYIPPPDPEQQDGPSFTGRETGGPNCFLKIRSLALNDTGNYIVSRTTIDGSETGRVHIEVLEKLSQPILWPSFSILKVHENITLNCTTSASSSVTISWFKNGKPVPAKSVLSKQNQILTVPDISKDDEGMYTCEARNLANSATSNPSKITLESEDVPEVHSSLDAGTIAGIVLGSLAIAALAGTLLYCFFRTCGQKDKNSEQMKPTSPVYENTRPSARVRPENSSGTHHTYGELQYENQPAYDQLRQWQKDPPAHQPDRYGQRL